MSLNAEHVMRVRMLYKTVLRLHRGLPLEIRALGDQYVKDEFRRHKNCDASFVPTFMMEWTNYAVGLAKELRKKPDNQMLGKDLEAEKLDSLSDDQVGQLYALFQEIHNPPDPNNPPENHPGLNQNPQAEK